MNFFNFRFSWRELFSFAISLITVIKKGVFIGGPSVEFFENEFSEIVGAESTVSCANGYDALRLAIRSSEFPVNSHIAVSAHTFFATWLAIIEEGFIPIGIDAQFSNGQMDPIQLEKALASDSKIKAVIYVHMHGIAGEIEKIAGLCREYKVSLIEDCAQAHGLEISGKHVGTFGAFGTFSFYPTKNMPAFGDAGCVISGKNYQNKLRTLANYGWGPGNREIHLEKGFNSRLDTIQAEFLRISLKNLSRNNRRRSKIAADYINFLKSYPEIKTLGNLDNSVWHHFPILVEKRDEFLAFMKARNVPCQIHYRIPCHLQPATAGLKESVSYQVGDFPVTEKISDQIVSLPMHPWLTDSDVNLVIESVREWCDFVG